MQLLATDMLITQSRFFRIRFELLQIRSNLLSCVVKFLPLFITFTLIYINMPFRRHIVVLEDDKKWDERLRLEMDLAALNLSMSRLVVWFGYHYSWGLGFREGWWRLEPSKQAKLFSVAVFSGSTEGKGVYSDECLFIYIIMPCYCFFSLNCIYILEKERMYRGINP